MKRRLRVLHPGVLPPNVSDLMWHAVLVIMAWDWLPVWMFAAAAGMLALEWGVAAYRLTFAQYVIPMTLGMVEVEDDDDAPKA